MVKHSGSTSSPPEAAASGLLRAQYVRVPQPLFFPSEDIVPESHRHLELRTALYEILKLEFGKSLTVGSDQFLYWDPSDPGQCLAPDIFVYKKSHERLFESWKVWQRGAPELCVEIVGGSDSQEANWGQKLQRYLKVGVEELVRFDPFADPMDRIVIWDNIRGDLVQRIQQTHPAHTSAALPNLFWVVVEDQENGPMLRLARDPAGQQLLPTPNEAREAAEQRVRELEAKLLSKGTATGG